MATSISAHQALTIFSWFAVTVLILLMLLIARFYESVSEEKTYYWAFGVPVIVFGISAARYAFLDRFSGDPIADALALLGGVVLIGMCLYLYHLMTQGR